MNRRIRIGVDARHLIYEPTGIGNYIAGTLQQIANCDENIELILYSHRSIHTQFDLLNSNKVVETSRILSRIGAFLWWLIVAQRYIKKDQPDILWCAGGFVPWGIGSTKTLVTVYDFVHRVSPQSMKLKNYLLYNIFHDRGLLQATYVSAISQGTSMRMQQYIVRKADFVHLPLINEIYCIHDDFVRHDGVSAQRPFVVLSVATFEPRKNLISLIRAIENIRLKHNKNIQLRLIGKNGWKIKQFLPLLKKNQEWITVLGYLPIEQLPIEYRSCNLFCLPSLYEGYGMPIREALNCGTAVVATASPEMQEAGNSDVIYAEPSVEGLENVLFQQIERETNNAGMVTKRKHAPAIEPTTTFSQKIRALMGL